MVRQALVSEPSKDWPSFYADNPFRGAGDSESKSEERVEGKGANGLIGLSCEQGESNMRTALALSNGPNPCIH